MFESLNPFFASIGLLIAQTFSAGLVGFDSKLPYKILFDQQHFTQSVFNEASLGSHEVILFCNTGQALSTKRVGMAHYNLTKQMESEQKSQPEIVVSLTGCIETETPLFALVTKDNTVYWENQYPITAYPNLKTPSTLDSITEPEKPLPSENVIAAFKLGRTLWEAQLIKTEDLKHYQVLLSQGEQQFKLLEKDLDFTNTHLPKKPIQILWAGDLNGDSQLDLLVQTLFQTPNSKLFQSQVLYFSTPSSKENLMEPVAKFLAPVEFKENRPSD